MTVWGQGPSETDLAFSVACILPSVSSRFGTANAPWVGIAYLLTQTTCSPIYGRMSDVFGRKVRKHVLLSHV